MHERPNLRKLHIAAPCNARWEDMDGDERTRFCADCKLNVHNISGMSETEALDLLQTPGRVCVRFYKRADGTVLTKDCPKGLEKLRRRAVRIAALAATALLSMLTLGFIAKAPPAISQGEVTVPPTEGGEGNQPSNRHPIIGKLAKEPPQGRHTMGVVAYEPWDRPSKPSSGSTK